MNDKEFEDILIVAMADSLPHDVPEAFKEALKKRASLASLIDALIAKRPRIRTRSWLEAMAGLNQGTLEDLNAPSFRSYIIEKVGIDELHLDECARELDVFRRLRDSSDQPIAMAARGDDLGNEQIAASELLERLAESDEE